MNQDLISKLTAVSQTVTVNSYTFGKMVKMPCSAPCTLLEYVEEHQQHLVSFPVSTLISLEHGSVKGVIHGGCYFYAPLCILNQDFESVIDDMIAVI